MSFNRSCALLLTLCVPATAVLAADWTNNGGNAARNGITSEVGPSAATLLWSGAPASIIAWQPLIEGSRVFAVRQTGFPPGGEPNGSPIVCRNLDTGAQLWVANIPFSTGDWTTWIAGVADGRLYASRSGNGASVADNLYCLDVVTGGTLWTSTTTIDAGPYDGVVFAPNGDPVVASFTSIQRFDKASGSIVWSTPRVCSVSSSCGGAIFGNALYVVDAVVGGHAIRRFDLATGALQYQGPVMPGFTAQNTPFVGPDGTIYFSRTQNNVAVDFFYAFADSGTAITQKWSKPAGWTTFSEFAVAPDGSPFHVAPGDQIHKLDPATGNTLASTSVIANGLGQARMAIDGQGRLYVSNGEFPGGQFLCFNADLTTRWSTLVININIGGPALGRDGTLVIAGTGSNFLVYRDPQPLLEFCFGDSTGTPCPCGPGSFGRGCPNSIDANGARLSASGTASVVNDTLVLAGSSMPNSSALYFQGSLLQGGGSGSLFGDGLRCAGGTIIRLGTKTNSGGASQYPGVGDAAISVRGLIPPTGGMRTYQCWYRNAAAFCSISTFNLTNGMRVTWAL